MQFAKYAEKYTNELKRWIEPLFVEKQPEISTERCCLNLTSKEISLIHINKTPTGIDLISSDILHYDEFEKAPLVLSAFLTRQQNWESIPTYWLLTPGDYQFFLIESLPVEAEELQEALNWRMRSLINFPIEEAVIDYFKLPVKNLSLDNMIASVAVQRSQLVTVIDILKKAGLAPMVIDIPELAMRNLSALYEDDEKSTAFIYFYDRLAILNITREKTLYFTRRIQLSAESTNTPDEYEQISLDILRYFDYFQSQWRYPSPTRIFIASEKRDSEIIAKKLSDYLLLAVTPFRLKSISGDKTLINSVEKTNLLTLGCALREDKIHVTPRN